MKTNNLTVAVFPIGSALKFRKENLKRSDGTSEYYKLIWALVRNQSISSVVILQRCDWKRLSSEEKIAFDPRGVLRIIHDEFDVQVPPGRRQGPDGVLIQHTDEERDRYKDMWDKIKDLEIPDFGVAFALKEDTLLDGDGVILTVSLLAFFFIS